MELVGVLVASAQVAEAVSEPVVEVEVSKQVGLVEACPPAEKLEVFLWEAVVLEADKEEA